MPDQRRSLADRIFAALLILLPRDFRAEHGAEMTQVFRAERREAAAARGRAGLARLWISATGGLLVAGPREHLSTLAADVRYALRAMRREPVFTAAAAVTLSLGIAATGTVLGVANAFWFRPLPVPQPDQLVSLASRDAHFELLHGLSYADIRDYRELTGVFSGVIGWSPMPAHLSGDRQPERVWLSAVTDDYFTVLGVPARLGRTIGPGEERLDTGGRVLVLTHRYWRRRFGGDPAVVGRALSVNRRPFTVIGVLPEWFEGTDTLLDLPVYTSLEGVMAAFGAFPRDRRDAHTLRVLARRRAGVSISEARAAVAVKARQLADAFPDTNRGVSVVVVPERQARPEPATGSIFRGVATSFLVLVGVLLLIVCANVANLQLARASARTHEIGVRYALGARSGRIVRQLLTESLLLSGLGAALGVLLANRAIGWIQGGLERYPSALTIRVDLGLDWGPLVLIAAIAVIAGVGTGLVPAVQAHGLNPAEPLRHGDRGARRAWGRRLRDALVVAQVALSLALLVVAGLFARSVAAARDIDVGFTERSMLLLSVDPALQGYDDGRRLAYYERAIERVRVLPGVRVASWTTFVPFTGNPAVTGVEAEGAPPASARERPSTLFMAAGDHYLATIGMPMASGRPFDARDDESAAPVAIVNHTLARLLWPGEDPIGRRLSTTGPEGPWLEIVGVVGDAKYLFLWEGSRPMLMQPLRQVAPGGATLQVATVSDPATLAAPVRAALAHLDDDLPVYDVKTLERHLRDGNALGLLRLASELTAAFGVFGLVLSVVGLYGVLAFSVSRRTHEIGVRVALGATPSGIVRLVLRHGLALSAVGLALGALVALWMTGLVSGLLVRVSPTDPLVFLATGAVLLVVALAACWVPARRALRVDPVASLRAE